MIVTEILNEIKERAHNQTLGNSALLTKINNEYDQTNLSIINLNEDYYYTEDAAFAVGSSGPILLPADFGKFRALIAPSGGFVGRVSPADESKPYGWYLSGTVISGGVARKQITFNADSPHELGNYKLRHVAFPPHLDETTNTVPYWPEPFHEIFILGALKRIFSVQDLYEMFPYLKDELKELREGLIAQVGALNLGANRDVRTDDDE